MGIYKETIPLVGGARLSNLLLKNVIMDGDVLE